MTKARADGLFLLVLGSVVFVLLGSVLCIFSRGTMGDFRMQYYPARCFLQHCDPYNEGEVLRVYHAEGGDTLGDPPGSRLMITRYIYPPSAFVISAPFAVLPLKVAKIFWAAASFGLLIFGGFLMWDIGSKFAPILSGVLIGALLANSELIVTNGNVAGIAVGLCVVAVWCFLKNRLVAIGILCLAASLAVKPQIAGLVWLFFLLARGDYRKRALQTLGVTIALSLPAVAWITYVAPHWAQELQSNVRVLSSLGGLAPATLTGPLQSTMMINLQPAISFFCDNASIYNSVTYLICGALILVWALTTLQRRAPGGRDLLALAAIAPLTMLPVYHRECDAKLLLLTVPACAMLWSEGGRIGRLAAIITSMALFVTADIPWAIDIGMLNHMHQPDPGLARTALTALQVIAVPLILLLTTLFYLFVYVRRTTKESGKAAG